MSSGIWVRSQSGESLVCCDGFGIANNDEGYLVTTVREDRVWALGLYPNKARALEVLDKIQQHINANISPYSGPHSFIHHMPKE